VREEELNLVEQRFRVDGAGHHEVVQYAFVNVRERCLLTDETADIVGQLGF
jgi:hypothetical protein